MLTDNPVMLRKHKPLPALMCAQRRAEKTIPDEEVLIQSNINSFGSEIGKITNYVTSMYEVRAGFSPGSEEYEVLSYRIRSGQNLQQNAIDKTKGIIAKDMPATWYSMAAIRRAEEDDSCDAPALYERICANKKPYFMAYIYPSLMSDYKKYVQNCDRSARRTFGNTISAIEDMGAKTLSDDMKERLDRFKRNLPVGTNRCTMNIICDRFEREFDGYLRQVKERPEFDYTILKAGVDYPESLYFSILQVYKDYNQALADYNIYSAEKKHDKDRDESDRLALRNEFFKKCATLCSNQYELADILVDICYSRDASKRFVWDMCASTIVENVASRNDNTISIPVLDPDGDIAYSGDNFKVIKKKVK